MNKRAFTVTALITCLTIHQAVAQTATSSIEAEVKEAETYNPPTLLQSPNFVLAPEARRAMIEAGFSTTKMDMNTTTKVDSIQNFTPITYEAKSKQSSEMQRGNIRAAYGLNRMFYVGANLEYGQSKTNSEVSLPNPMVAGFNTTTKGSASDKGLTEPEIFAGLRLRGEKITTLIEGGFLASTGPKTVSTSNEANGLDGQSKIALRAAAYNHLRGDFLVGGQLGYTHAMNGRQINQIAGTSDLESDLKGGNEAKAAIFGQLTNLMDLGGRLTYLRSYGSERSYQIRNMWGAQTTQTDSSSGMEQVVLEASMRWRPVAGVSVIPALNYAQMMGMDSRTKIDSQSVLGGSVNARFSF